MTTDNSEQIAEWNGALGQRWAQMQAEIDAVAAPFGDAALEQAAAQAGERVIDIGCGCGGTSLRLARQVGDAGAVLGIDVSQPMLEVARSRARAEGCANLVLREADASVADLPGGNDLLFSRFGTMFFSHPDAAFVHLRRSLRDGGRCVFVCWRTPRDNGWAMTPLLAARQALGITAAPVDPFAPGPFAFADEDRLRAILSSAGFAEIALRRFNVPVLLGATPAAAAEGAVRIGPLARLARDLGPQRHPDIVAAVERALTPLAAADGQVRLNGSTWIVSAANPA